jgi:hypothetical protein
VPVGDWSAVLAPWPLNAVTGARLKSPSDVSAYIRAYPGVAPPPLANFTDTRGTRQVVINAVTVGDTASGATHTVIEMVSGVALSGGMAFQDFNERVYRILWAAASGNIYTCATFPPVRTMIPAGTQLNFDSPELICRLEKDDSMAIKGGFVLRRFAETSLVLWEDI